MKLRRSVPLLLAVLTAGVVGFFAGRMFPAAGESAGPGKGAKVVPLAARESSRTAAGPAAGKDAAQAMSPQMARVLARLKEWLGSNASSADRLSKSLGQWLAECPSDVLDLLEESPRRDDLLRAAASMWAERDAAGLSKWLGAAGDFEGRDAVMAGMAVELAREGEEPDIGWIASIKNPEEKLLAARNAAYSFYRHSDEAARQAFQKMGLPATSFDSLLDGGVREVHRAVTRQKAQDLAREFDSALAAEAEFAPLSATELLEGLRKGISGTGQFSGRVFKVDTTNWTPREIEDTLKLLEVSDGKVQLKQEQPKAP